MVRYEFILVQPGISLSKIDEKIARCLASTQEYLQHCEDVETFEVWGSP
jgi:hypothetical protein